MFRQAAGGSGGAFMCAPAGLEMGAALLSYVGPWVFLRVLDMLDARLRVRLRQGVQSESMHGLAG